MLLVQAVPKKGSFILSVTRKIPPESPINNTGRIFNLEMQKTILSDEIWKEKCSEQLVWTESVAAFHLREEYREDLRVQKR